MRHDGLRCGRPVAQRTMRPDGVVMLSPALDQYLRLPEGVEDFHIQKLVPQFAIEAFVITVFPWTAGFDEQRFHADPPQSNYPPRRVPNPVSRVSVRYTKIEGWYFKGNSTAAGATSPNMPATRCHHHLNLRRELTIIATANANQPKGSKTSSQIGKQADPQWGFASRTS